jgi:hypothetical protein
MAEDLNDLNEFQDDRERDGEDDEKSACADDLFDDVKSLDDIIAERGRPMMTHDQIVEKWAGVFPEEYWDIVDERRAEKR